MADKVTLSEKEALRAHASFLTGLVDKEHAIVLSTPPDQNLHYSTITLYAFDRAAADALIRTDQAVREGVLAYEIVNAED